MVRAHTSPVGELPSGTLTLLFSDIEGSTALLLRLGEAWGDALSTHRALLRSAWAAHGGAEMGTEGDSFFVVFESAHDAVRAAVAAQQAVHVQSWPQGVTLRVRMGLHTGEPKRHEDGYVGEDVHRAARIGATAHGGQIVVSATTARLVRDLEHAAAIELRDLGEHRLKDFPDPEQLFDVVAPGLPSAFPPLRSLGRKVALPRSPTELIGREGELDVVVAQLRDHGQRLLTITGPGGSGKTRLATEVASSLDTHFRDGVYFVPLHTVTTPEAMWRALAEAVGAPSDVAPDAAVHQALAKSQVLVVLDNLEQIAGADGVVAQLLDVGAGVSVLATSRRPLLLVAEHEFPLAPLSVPASDSTDDVARSAAVTMFVERSAMARPEFAVTDDNRPAIAELCRRLDGLPLALELAAAQTRLFSPRALLERLDSALGSGLTAADRPERQRSLSATISWSYELLEPADRAVFRRLSVFRRAADLAAVAAVAADGPDGAGDGEVVAAVTRLAAASLLQIGQDASGEPRVGMLETVRRYAADRLDESGDAPRTRQRHLNWCADVAAEASDMLHAPLHTRGLDRFAEIDSDIRAALDFAFANAGASPDIVRRGQDLLLAVTTYWFTRGDAALARQQQQRAVDLIGSEPQPGSTDLLFVLGRSMFQQGDLEPAERTLRRAVDLARGSDEPEQESRALNLLGIVRRQAGHTDEAMALLEQSLAIARRIGSLARQAFALGNIAIVHIDRGEFAEAAGAAEEAMRLNAETGNVYAVAIDRLNHCVAVVHSAGATAAAVEFQRWLPDLLAFGSGPLAIDALEVAAMIAVALREPVTAAKVLAVAERERAAAELPRAAAEQKLIEPWRRAAHEALDEQEWATAQAQGAALTVEQALRLLADVPVSR